ncbi:MAG: metal ABC transporter ATP-binding protein [Candidatus Auribacterota bacterium]
MPTDYSINFTDVSFAYNGSSIIENASFTIDTNESVCIIGPNGGGKTTLLKLMLGLVKPQNGTVTIGGGKVEAIRTCIGYMPQYLLFDPQFPVTVMDIVLMGRLGLKRVGLYGKQDKITARRILDELGMRHLENRMFSQLSGGERQRILIARALSCEPRILLLDEATSNVDIFAEAQLMDVIQRLAGQMTVVMVSHDIGFVSHLFKRVICVNRKVFVHETKSLSGPVMEKLYGNSLRVVDHQNHME